MTRLAARPTVAARQRLRFGLENRIVLGLDERR